MPFANNDGVDLFWRQDGDPTKPPLLLLNSIGTDLSIWDRLVPRLSGRAHILRMDARGHGRSGVSTGDYALALLAADALAVMDAAGVARAHICGLSLGGMIAMTLALDHPARVDTLILACTSAQMDTIAWDARAARVRSGGMNVIAEMAMGRFFGDGFRAHQPGVVDEVRQGLLRMNREGYAGCAAAIRDMALTPRLGEISARTLVIAALADVSTPYAGHGDALAATIPGARAVILDAAHLACLEDPEGMAAAITSFVDAGEVAHAETILFEAGLKNRRAVLGDGWVDRSLAGRTPFNAEFQAMITRVAWHEVWGRPGLDHRTRRLLVLAITAALGRWEEFRLHVRAGLEQKGFTEDELKETLMQTAIYAGVPAANTAFAESAAVIRSLDKTPQP